MRLAFDARMVYYRRAGIGQYCLHLLRALAALPHAEVHDLRVTVVQSRKDREQLVPATVIPTPATIIPTPATVILSAAKNLRFYHRAMITPPHNRFEQVGLALELAGLRADVIHSPDFIPPFHRRFPAVITVHDLAFLRFPELLTKESARYYGQIDRAVQSAEAIIAVSACTADDLAQLAGADTKKIHVIHEAADPVFAPASRPVNARPGYILFLGTIEPRKNLPTLLEAYRLLLDGGRVRPAPFLWLAGRPGWLYDETLAAIQRLKLSDKVHLLDRMDSAALPALYQQARLFVLPSLYEGFGLSALEALASGIPVLASNAGALPEIVGDAGILLPPDDPAAWAAAMERVLLDRDLAADLRGRGPLRAAAFSWERAARQTLDVYRSVVRSD
ncbi:MAG: glycosyltransferase family 4 protein [Chloroflexia bacterium]